MRILIVDDDARVRESLAGLLNDAGHRTGTCATGEEALGRSGTEPWDAFLLDVMLPGMDGLELLERLRKSASSADFLMMSGRSSMSTAVRATRLGAHNFFEKPVNPEKLLLELRHLREQRALKQKVASLQDLAGGPYGLIGESAPMRELKALIAKAAPSEGRVLIAGENGTGKELVARAIHAGSPRSGGPFVSLNCAAIPKDLVESELFGHEKGAFTGAVQSKPGRFENAEGGTLFLDEIADMSPEVQAKLLRVLQENEAVRVGGGRPYRFDVRIIAATNKDLQAETRAGRFRDDLYYRLNVIPVSVPPLRDRKTDIPVLAAHFLNWFGERTGKGKKRFEPDALQMLQSNAWPGNVRELRNFVERLIILHEGECIRQEDISAMLPHPAAASEPAAAGPDLSFRERVQRFEKDLLSRLHRETQGNVSEMARRLSMDRSNLHRKLRRYGIH